MKRDLNDSLFSQLKRLNRLVCQRCGEPHKLNVCHIFSRKYYSTRFDPENAVVLCYACHNWFDSHKIERCLFDEGKRVFSGEDESFHFLVAECEYEWDQLVGLYRRAQSPFRGYKSKKEEIASELRAMIADELL